jgi:hypothetical protein
MPQNLEETPASAAPMPAVCRRTPPAALTPEILLALGFKRWPDGHFTINLDVGGKSPPVAVVVGTNGSQWFACGLLAEEWQAAGRMAEVFTPADVLRLLAGEAYDRGRERERHDAGERDRRKRWKQPPPSVYRPYMLWACQQALTSSPAQLRQLFAECRRAAKRHPRRPADPALALDRAPTPDERAEMEGKAAALERLFPPLDASGEVNHHAPPMRLGDLIALRKQTPTHEAKAWGRRYVDGLSFDDVLELLAATIAEAHNPLLSGEARQDARERSAALACML